jgi:predicted helicase
MPEFTKDEIRAIKTFPQLVKYLRDELDWPIETEDFEEITFDYNPEELGIDPATAAKILEIKQLRPMTANQPWGIFFLKFEPKKLPVVVLRRILSKLVIKKRASAKTSERAVWNLHDLLFISNYGEGDQRQITFANFSQDENLADLPTLKVLGWDYEDTELHIINVHNELKAKLRWPYKDKDIKQWRETWSSAFILRNREVITTSIALAIRLASLAQRIRERVKRVLKLENANGPMQQLYKAFQETLIHDLTEDDFADMYAQTIAYGLLAARMSRPMGITSSNIIDMVPNTNPFLRDILGTFIATGGRQGKIDFDELGVQEIVELLNSPDTHMEAVLRDFGNRTRQEDPVIHFYELFLTEYDKKKKIQRGVFYTPQPVVSYIVRSVHELLQKEFGLEDGLADITTWGEMAKWNKDIKIPEGASPVEPFVQILDPAVGTATFLVEVIDVIHKTMTAKWLKQRHMALEFPQLWNEYVSKHLLPRLFGYELMMAPYAIAHMRLGLKLYETGYRFGSETPRANVYLTNSLEPASESGPHRKFEQLAPALAHEAKAVNDIKLNKRFTVVIGNPPYAGLSANLTPRIRELVQRYKFIGDQKIIERGALQLEKNLQDDYVKFIAYSQDLLTAQDFGILGMITSHGYLDNPTLRGLRWSLLCLSRKIWTLDLHGNVNRIPLAPAGTPDQNVFDIKDTGVAVLLLSVMKSPEPGRQANAFHYEIWGNREKDKYPFLLRESVGSTNWQTVIPKPDLFILSTRDGELDDEYNAWPKVTDVFPLHSIGIITARDKYVIDYSKEPIIKRARAFQKSGLSDEATCKSLGIPIKKGWNIKTARNKIRDVTDLKSHMQHLLYRPFDNRFVFYHESLIWGMAKPVMQHMVNRNPTNLALICSRMTKGESFKHVLASNSLSEVILLSSKTSNNAFVFPLYKYEVRGLFQTNDKRSPNIAQHFITALEATTLLIFIPEGRGDFQNTIGPEGLYNYFYAILSAPGYRARYEEQLRSDFPRLPLTSHSELFRAMSHLGSVLVALHLMESPLLNTPITKWLGSIPSNEVEKITYSDETVWINKGQSEGFIGVPEDVWNFHIGGYQVCEKWLKDRKGRNLSAEDIAHYQKIVVALNETIRLMKEIDEVIDAHGGWPGAFA